MNGFTLDTGGGGAKDVVREDLSALPDLPSADLPSDDAGDETPCPDCFMAPCLENSDCLSSWCVQHLGQSVCSQSCVDDCPAGWGCKQVAGVEPDAVFICLSSF